MRKFSSCPWIPLKLDSIFSLFKCVMCLRFGAFLCFLFAMFTIIVTRVKPDWKVDKTVTNCCGFHNILSYKCLFFASGSKIMCLHFKNQSTQYSMPRTKKLSRLSLGMNHSLKNLIMDLKAKELLKVNWKQGLLKLNIVNVTHSSNCKVWM